MPGVPYDVLKGACAEGALMVYHGTWSDAQKAQIAKFTDHFPCVKVQALESEPAPMRARFLAETRAGRDVADIIQDSDPGVFDNYVDQGMIAKYEISNEKSYDAALKRPGYWYPLRVALVGMAWNSSLVSPDKAKLLSDWKGAIDPIWAGHDGGWSHSLDRGATWSSSSNVMPVSQFYDIDCTHDGAGTFIGGTQDNGTLKSTGGVAWGAVFSGDGGVTHVDPVTPTTVYTEYTFMAIQKSTNSGSTWTRRPSESSTPPCSRIATRNARVSALSFG